MTEPRVLHVVEASLGGVRRYLEDIAVASIGRPWTSGLAYADHRADAQFPAFLARCKELGWSLFRVPMQRAVRPTRDLAALLRLRAVMTRFRPDVVHCHSAKAGALGRVAAKSLRTRRPFIAYSPHASAAHLGGQYAVIERVLVRAATDMVVAVSESERRHLVESKLAGPNTSVLWPVVDTDRVQPRPKDVARAELGIASVRPVVVGIGRLSSQKNPLAFVDLVSEVRRNVPDVLGIWVGDGELRQEVVDASHRLGIADRLRVTGWQTDVAPYTAASDVVVVPSNYESFGYATAEALAMERPVVATRVPGTVDIVRDGESGALYDLDDPRAGVDAVTRLLESATAREAAGRKGRLFVRDAFAPSRMAEALEHLYGGARARRTASVAATTGV